MTTIQFRDLPQDVRNFLKWIGRPVANFTHEDKTIVYNQEDLEDNMEERTCHICGNTYMYAKDDGSDVGCCSQECEEDKVEKEMEE